MRNFYKGGYISTLSVLDEMICELDCNCLKNMRVYEELSDEKTKKYRPNITTIDNVIKMSSNPISIIINIALPSKDWKKISDIVTCLTCVNDLVTDNYIIHKSHFQSNSLIATELVDNTYKKYQGTLILDVSRKEK